MRGMKKAVQWHRLSERDSVEDMEKLQRRKGSSKEHDYTFISV